MRGILASIAIGKIQTHAMPKGAAADARHPHWTSAIFKTPLDGPVQVTPTHVAGDEQADLNFHGGPDNVVLAYAAAHYRVWRKELDLPGLAFGSFGENFTIEADGEEFSDETVCIGDVWRVGSGPRAVTLQVTQPRQPCSKLARRLERSHIVKMVRDRGWGGWYSRVLATGSVEAGMPVELIERTHPQWTCVAAVMAMYGRKQDPGRAAALATLPELSARWKRELLVDE